jgi:HEAT repeat protein
VDALGRALRAPVGQDRAAAAKGLGLALIYRKNERARPLLEAARNDPDDFVRRKAAEALAGKTRSDY